MVANKHGLPEMFRPLLWSYRFEDIDPDVHFHELVVNTINYGTLQHWRWLQEHYGRERLQEILKDCLETELNRESKNLAKVLFNIRYFRHARGSAY